MNTQSLDTLMRVAAFEHVRRLNEIYDHLTAAELKPGFVFRGERIPLVNPQRGIFKSQQMRFLLSIKTVFPNLCCSMLRTSLPIKTIGLVSQWSRMESLFRKFTTQPSTRI
jgi:hypothetical protein